MGGEGSGRKPSVETLIARATPKITPVGTGVFIPDYSGVAKHTRTRQTFIEQNRKYLYYYHDDFINTAGTTLGDAGSWTRGSVIAGSANWANGDAEANHFGVIELNSGTTAPSINTLSKTSTGIRLSGGEVIEIMIKLNVRDDPLNVGDDYQLLLGLSDLANSFSPNDALGFYLPNSDGSTYPNWFMLSAAGGNVTTEDTGVATHTGWQVLKIALNDAGTLASFYIDDVLIGTQSANLPVGDSNLTGFYLIGKNVTYTSDTIICLIDYFTFYKQIPTGRI